MMVCALEATRAFPAEVVLRICKRQEWQDSKSISTDALRLCLGTSLILPPVNLVRRVATKSIATLDVLFPQRAHLDHQRKASEF